MGIAEGSPEEGEVVASGPHLEERDVPLANDVAEDEAASGGEDAYALAEQRRLVAHEVRRFEHPDDVERAVVEAVVGAVPLLEDCARQAARRRQLRWRPSTPFALVVMPSTDAPRAGGQIAGLAPGPASDVEHPVAGGRRRPA